MADLTEQLQQIGVPSNYVEALAHSVDVRVAVDVDARVRVNDVPEGDRGAYVRGMRDLIDDLLVGPRDGDPDYTRTALVAHAAHALGYKLVREA